MVDKYPTSVQDLLSCMAVHLGLDLCDKPFASTLQFSKDQQIWSFSIRVAECRAGITVYSQSESPYLQHTLMVSNPSDILARTRRKMGSHASTDSVPQTNEL